MEDTKTITLPVSGKTVEIRNYTTREDDLKAEATLYSGVKAKSNSTAAAEGETDIEFPVANMMAARTVYVYRLVRSIDSDTSNIKNRLEELRTEDYKAIDEAVDEITSKHSPKAKEDKSASKQSTSGK